MSDVVGSPFTDVITGDGQANRIDAGAGADKVSAGTGPDALLLHDGEGDTADCGDGDVAAKVAVRRRSSGATAPFLGGSATVALTAGKRRALAFRLTAKSARKVRAALRRGDTVTVRVTATARDAAGNRGAVKRSITLRG